MTASRPIVLLTDFGSDFYTGVLKAVIAAGAPASRVIDLQHDVPAHDVSKASFVVARSFEYLPDDAVVVVVVDPGVGGERRGLVIKIGGRVLVGPDNGFASDLVVSGADVEAFAIDESALEGAIGIRGRGATFHGRDVFGPVAAAIARGADAAAFGAPAGGIALRSDIPSVSIDGGRVRGTGRYVDRFGNVLTDIPLAMVRRACGDEAHARVSAAGRELGFLRRTYGEGRSGELIALVNSWGLVEAAMNGGPAIDRFDGAAPESIVFEIWKA